MTPDLESTTALLLELPPRDRLRLGETLIESVGEFIDDETAESWRVEIERRIADWKSGAVQPIPAEEVFAKTASILSRQGRDQP